MRIDFSQKGLPRIVHRIAREYGYATRRQWTYKEVGRFWDDVADYDEINKKTYSYARRFIDGMNLSAIPDNSYVLDICGRTGNGTIHFHAGGKIARAVCMDVSPRMLDICRRRCEERSINSTAVLFDALPLPFRDHEFDAILCFETIEHMPEPGRFLKELARILRPGGGLLLTTPNRIWELGHRLAAILALHHSEGPHRFLRRSAILRMAREARLSLEREKTTVLIPCGPRLLTAFNECLERTLPERVLRAVALRRIFVFRRPLPARGEA